MQTSDANPNLMTNDPVWYILADFPLGEFLPGHDRNDETMIGTLVHALQELEMPPESIKTIAMTLSGFAKEAQGHFQPGRGWVRIFGHHKLRNEGRYPKTARLFTAARAIEQIQKISQSSQNLNGGWGFFLIETGGKIPADSSHISWNSVDLYLYNEGE